MGEKVEVEGNFFENRRKRIICLSGKSPDLIIKQNCQNSISVLCCKKERYGNRMVIGIRVEVLKKTMMAELRLIFYLAGLHFPSHLILDIEKKNKKNLT